ncbi:hypothetical protein [Geobacter grbiciae]|uniref:hypothetical protein n=1 Tax=Geobacter grbiciae TaxID=155042 RepID=UPI001C01F5B5|nr:hypothetical protein [Geobacter grbiciae]MBT1076977.1 hypothetical protein [Geobacter grbiciae]
MHEFKIDGPAFKEGSPIHISVAALDSFQSILDKSYLVLAGAKRMSAKDREIFYLRATSFRQGSLLTNFEIVLSGIQLGLPFVSSFGPQNFWEYTKDSFSFLKNVCTAVQKNEKPTYEFNNQGDASVHIGDNHYHYHAPVIQIAELALPNYQDLAHLIDPLKVNKILSKPANQEEPDIYIGPKDRGMFDIPTRIEKETVYLKCEIYDFNKYKNKGKLSVKIPEQAVPQGDYNFEIFGSQDNVEYIYSMLKPLVELYCLIEMESNPFGDDKVNKLHITGVNS